MKKRTETETVAFSDFMTFFKGAVVSAAAGKSRNT